MLKTVQISSTDTSSFNIQLHKLTESTDSKVHLKIQKILGDEELTHFGEFIENQHPFPVNKLSLLVDLNTLQNPRFLANLEQLNDTRVSCVELILPEEEVQHAHQKIRDILTTVVAPEISYPLQVKESGAQGVVSSTMELEGFNYRIIANIQKRHGEPEDVSAWSQAKANKRTLDPQDPMAKKIKLKALIKSKKIQEAHFAQYIPVEVEHVEQVEQEVVQEQQEVVEVQQRMELNEIQEYGGQLLGFQDFMAPIYKNKVNERTGNEIRTNSLYQLLRQELFANLPHAIKFVSPDAAEQLALNLPALVTLNKENLPNGFILKQTKDGELVLDFDPYLENEQSNPFTPVESEFELEPIYNIELQEQDVKKWIGDEKLCSILCPSHPYTTPKQLVNMWIKHGDEGVTAFFTALKKATESQPGLVHWLMQNHLVHFSQLDHLFNNQAFFSCLERISHYDEDKLNCLKRFLEKTGSSQHDLNKTVAAFEVFWNELNLICTEQKVSIAGINNSNWSTPEGGNPVVYMERMLIILKNARNLNDQFTLLKDITLDNYGAYYASRFEGFKAVSAEMLLIYNADNQDMKPFNKNLKNYRSELEHLTEPFIQSKKYEQFVTYSSFYDDEVESPYWLVNCENELPEPLNLEQLKSLGLVIPFKSKDFVPPYQFYRRNKNDGSMTLLLATNPGRVNPSGYIAHSFRYIGTQTSGITVSSLIEQFDKFKENFWEGMDLSTELLAILFFISHERFIESQPLKPLFTSLDRASTHKHVIFNSINLLAQLYKLDIKLNQAEGLMLFESIAGMNSCEFECTRISKDYCINKLLEQLQHNKFATFKLFDFRVKKSNPKWPFVYALDTAEFLAKDPMIAATYHDDLLLFSGLINSISREAYYHKRFADDQMQETPEAKIILTNMEGVKNYLHLAATQPKPNNLQYAIKVIINAKNYFTYEKFLSVCKEIEQLAAFDSKKVDELLRQHQFAVGAELPELFTKDNSDLKGIMISLMLQLDQINGSKKSEPMTYEQLAPLSIAQLQVELQKLWQEAGTLLAITGKLFLDKILKTIKETAIKFAFHQPQAEGLLKAIANKIDNLSDFQDYGDFEKVNRRVDEAEKIAHLFKTILNNPYVKEHEQEFIALFQNIDFSRIDYETLYAVLFLLTTMPQRNYLSLLNTFFADERFIGKKERVVELLNLLTALNNSYFPSEYLDAFCKLVISNPGEKEYNLLMNQMIAVYNQDNKDPILELIMAHPELTYKQVTHLMNLSEGISNNRDKISTCLIHLVNSQQLEPFLNELAGAQSETQNKIIEIISKGHGLNRMTKDKEALKYKDLAALLKGLSVEELGLLHSFYEATPVSAECLLNALKKPERTKDFHHFLLEFEKAPFGERDFQKQFSCTEIERVINQSKDLINNTVYPYQYRKQLMEAFLFVNEIGENLPIYYNKPAKDLSNAEIKSYFADLKANKISGLTPFQSRLIALGLMRESMYRSTGEFPYSTQMIALIDGMMHEGDFISNIDTGQGKSLVDSMKAALLWLDSDRVDLTTSSLVDARRDIANYGSFLKLLGIPYSTSPISSASSTSEFQQKGINFSTFAQLSLFFAKAKVTGLVLETPATKVSLVANESDYTLLDDRVIYRFASADGSGISYGQEWIYYGLNEFVSRPEFIANDKTSAAEDITDLKNYLKIKARELKKSGKIVDKFSDAQYLSWLESALTVNYVLKENVDYVIPDEFEKKVINGTELRSKVAKVLMKDKKVSPDSTFGNGIQQLLYARLNTERGCTDFVIEPQHKTIISTNNKNLIDYYRARKGYIWGSSGTVGSCVEIQELYRKYGFEFSKEAPHQINRVKFNSPIIEKDETTQFKRLISQLTAGNPVNQSAPSLVFCKDINTAIRLFKELEKQNPKQFPLQLYTGIGKEEDYIHNASKPGMITITTTALGRNTDIHYDKIQGLRVWHTFVDSTRGDGQMSGRTGRQGSAGEVNYVLNAQELGGKSIAEIRTELDKAAALERNINEELYNVLGYLLLQIDLMPGELFTKGKSAFIREAWSQFSSETEAEFRETRRDAAYDKEGFIQKTLASFNHMIATAVKLPVQAITLEELNKVLDKIHQSKASYHPYIKEVKRADCTPPIDIAYHLLNVVAEEKAPEETKKAITRELTQLFKHITKDSFVAESGKYLRYLVANPTTRNVIVEAHKEFLTRYLQEHSTQLNFIQRWLGYEGKLSKMASNENYLMMFHAFASIPNQPVVELDVIKHAVNRLLDEYLETSWFIASNRKQWVANLKKTISQTTDIDALILCLSQTQVEVAKQDIAANKERMFKSLHLFGHSRYQSTLNKALNLATSLSAKTEVNDLASGLTPLLEEVTDHKPLADLNLDELKNKAKAQKSDSANASVIIEVLENAVAIKNRKGPEGMRGRSGFFSPPTEENITEDDNCFENTLTTS